MQAKAKPENRRGTRLPADWLLPKAWGEWAMTERPGWSADDVRRESEQFRDYWLAKAGKDAAKIDWLATWRTWVRRSVEFAPRNGAKPRDSPPGAMTRDARIANYYAQKQALEQGVTNVSHNDERVIDAEAVRIA